MGARPEGGAAAGSGGDARGREYALGDQLTLTDHCHWSLVPAAAGSALRAWSAALKPARSALRSVLPCSGSGSCWHQAVAVLVQEAGWKPW